MGLPAEHLVGRADELGSLERVLDELDGGCFDEVFRTEGVRIVRSPVRAPKANAICERWVGTVRRECLDHLLVLGRRHLERVLTAYAAHYNGSRPHRALDLGSPELRGDPPATVDLGTVRRRHILGGLIHEYEPAAA